MMLSVGRLHPVKQQDLLVEAWANSDLWKTYNLVLVSGNLEDPNDTEQEMLTRIEKIISRYPHVSGRLCFTGAMSNAEVRILEQSIIQHAEGTHPHVYVCSSIKEEFGIAVLEAMSTGFLLFGPERGGLSSYVHHGENGFLFDTSSAQTMAETLSRVLLNNQPDVEHLGAIAEAGQKTVRETFDIRQIAPQFAEFYQEIVTASQE
jgi:glycosyltransferase involved in cell wall biosynthesis